MELHDEELDRRLIDLNHGPALCDLVKASIGKKVITFTRNESHIHADYKGRDERISFSKSSLNGESLNFKIEWNEFEIKRCDLGHFHQSRLEKREYKSFSLDWSHVEQLIEWIQLGSWSQSNQKVPKELRLLQECKTLFKEIAQKHKDSSLEPAMRKMINRIQGFDKFQVTYVGEENGTN